MADYGGGYGGGRGGRGALPRLVCHFAPSFPAGLLPWPRQALAARDACPDSGLGNPAAVQACLRPGEAHVSVDLCLAPAKLNLACRALQAVAVATVVEDMVAVAVVGAGTKEAVAMEEAEVRRLSVVLQQPWPGLGGRWQFGLLTSTLEWLSRGSRGPAAARLGLAAAH